MKAKNGLDLHQSGLIINSDWFMCHTCILCNPSIKQSISFTDRPIIRSLFVRPPMANMETAQKFKYFTSEQGKAVDSCEYRHRSGYFCFHSFSHISIKSTKFSREEEWKTKNKIFIHFSWRFIHFHSPASKNTRKKERTLFNGMKGN